MKNPNVRETVYTDEFCKKHGRVVYALALRVLGDKERARDLEQEVWLRVMMYSGEFHGESERATYIYKIAKNECFRDQEKHRLTFQELDDDMPLPDYDGPDRQLERQDLFAMFDRCIDALPELQKAALILYVYGGLLYKEISSVLGVDEKIVGMAISRARRRIKKALDMEGVKL